MSTKTPPKRNLTAEEKRCADRLKAIYERVKVDKKLSQASLGETMGISQSAVGQYLNGTIPLNLDAKLNFALSLGCDVTEIDPDILKPFFDAEELRLISAYRLADQSKKETILGVAELARGYLPHQKHTE